MVQVFKHEGIGPQNPGDDSLCERLRFHQSWYRATVLGVGYGRGPTVASTRMLGNMLDDDAGAQGLNFLTPEIGAVASTRMGLRGGVEKFRCQHNTLSSQTMCFNLFGPLVGRNERATRLVGAAFGHEIREVTDVRIEYAPEPKTSYTGDGSSFDAFIEYLRRDGEPAFLAIETKFSESFSATEYAMDGRRKALTEDERSPWLAARWPLLTSARWNQLWRNHLLVHAVLVNAAPTARRYAQGTLALVRHDIDSEIEGKAAGYAALLKDQSTFADVRLSMLVDAWQAVAADDHERDWLHRFRQRYVDLAGSELAYHLWLRAGRPAMTA